jgi:hypothetical protein
MINPLSVLIEEFKRSFLTTDQIPDQVKFSLEITKKLILDNKSVLSITPILNRKYITNEDKGVFISIYLNNINIIKKNYNIITYIEDTKLYDDVCRLFNKTLEKSRLDDEASVSKNVEDSLEELLNSI